ncbi:MAG: 50S ribosomal protein L31 [Legionellales bacterium RIFCSPHIGHO2_12_FULL_35_11]|nr:MAG: 50S ribosomal protein L31 [Legionellales bacterium RIFCSPHIGHO2_12_FULL_35_11]
MKKETHPDYEAIKVTCSCGNVIETKSTICQPLNIEVCSSCHPFYTGKQKIIDTGGRVQKFNERYKRTTKASNDVDASASK